MGQQEMVVVEDPQHPMHEQQNEEEENEHQQHQVEDSMHDNNNNNTNNTSITNSNNNNNNNNNNPVPNSVVHVMARVPSDPIPPPQLIQSPTLEPAVFRGGDGDDEQSNQHHLMPPDLGEALGIKSSSSDSLVEVQVHNR